MTNRRLILVLTALVTGFAASCATAPAGADFACSVTRIEAVSQDAVAYAGQKFCGEVYVVEYGRSARIIIREDQMPPSNDIALLVASDTRRLLSSLSNVPQRFYIEARLDPVIQCFSPSASGEDCSPYRRPVIFHLFAARRVT